MAANALVGVELKLWRRASLGRNRILLNRSQPHRMTWDAEPVCVSNRLHQSAAATPDQIGPIKRNLLSSGRDEAFSFVNADMAATSASILWCSIGAH